MDAFEAGVDARRRGDCVDMNPYDELDAQWDEWDDGWYSSDDEPHGGGAA